MNDEIGLTALIAGDGGAASQAASRINDAKAFTGGHSIGFDAKRLGMTNTLQPANA